MKGLTTFANWIKDNIKEIEVFIFLSLSLIWTIILKFNILNLVTILKMETFIQRDIVAFMIDLIFIVVTILLIVLFFSFIFRNIILNVKNLKFFNILKCLILIFIGFIIGKIF